MVVFVLFQLAVCVTVSLSGVPDIPGRHEAVSHDPTEEVTFQSETYQTLQTSGSPSDRNDTKRPVRETNSTEDAWLEEDYMNNATTPQMLTAEANELVTLKYDESGCWFPCFHFYEPICTVDMHVGMKTFWNFCVWRKYNWCHKTDYRFRHPGVCKPLSKRELHALYTFTGGKKY